MNSIHPKCGEAELACLGRDAKPSPFGIIVANILAVAWGGLHHIDSRELRKAEWDDEHCIALNFHRSQWATTDFNELTMLVILAHDACVRIAISSPGMKLLRLTFHPRVEVGSYSQRHPTLSESIEEVRKRYTCQAGGSENGKGMGGKGMNTNPFPCQIESARNGGAAGGVVRRVMETKFKVGDLVRATGLIERADGRARLSKGQTAIVEQVFQLAPDTPQIIGLKVGDDVIRDIVCVESCPLELLPVPEAREWSNQ